MANVAHATLTGSNLHEPKGITTAANGQVYVANGVGTGVWTDISATSFVGQVADFATPVVPTGWLECDGTDVSKITYPALFSAMTIQNTATRGSGSPIVTLTSGNTNNMRPGYFVYGLVAGQFVSGTIINSVDSSVQFTMSVGASSGGTATVVVSPWLLNTNTIRLPNVSAAARYRRSRTAGLHIGATQADLVKTHTHPGTTTSTGSGHVHAFSSGTNVTGVSSVDLDHTHTVPIASTINIPQGTLGNALYGSAVSGGNTGAVNPANLANMNAHTHTITMDAGGGLHTHTFTTDSNDVAAGEVRPVTLVLMTCVKT